MRGMTEPVSEQDAWWLRYAFELAVRSREAGDQPFGAVLVGADGELVAEALNTRNLERDLAAHAEMNLVRRAVHLVRLEELARCTLYSSSEPCLMCAGVIAWSGIGTVVFGGSQRALMSIPVPRPPRFRVPTDIHQLLSGVQPFFGVNAKEVMRRHMEERPLAPSEKLGRALTPEMEELVLKLLAKDPESRPPTARAVEELLAEVIEPMLGQWTDEEGDAWWRANAPQLIGSDGDGEPGGPPVKLDVDVESRAGRI
jgi:tRNA(Arg) A34 adenosine deaminase TadA